MIEEGDLVVDESGEVYEVIMVVDGNALCVPFGTSQSRADLFKKDQLQPALKEINVYA